VGSQFVKRKRSRAEVPR